MEIIQTVSSIFTTLLLAGIFWLCTRFISTYEDMLKQVIVEMLTLILKEI